MKGPLAVALAVASALVGVSLAWAQDPARPPGDPAQARKKADPPTPFPGGYLDHAALTDALQTLAKAHPDLVRVDSVAKSRGGRDVWIATVGRGKEEDGPRPSVLIVANLEADHVVGSQVALGLIGRLAEGIGNDPALAKVLEGRTIQVISRLNPDGAERVLNAKPKTEFRANLGAIDRDRDGKTNEDGPNDVDGDGFALAMRVKDARATLVPDARDPRILRKADPATGERPVYSEMSEGIDDDGDGSIDEDPPGGVNLNRNWPQGWAEYSPEAGAYPASEPEVEGLIRFAFAHPEIVAVWSFGLNDNLRGTPQGPDAPHLAELIRAFAAATAPKPEPPADEPAKKAEAPKDEPRPEATKEEPRAAPAPAPPAPASPPEAPRPKAQRKGQGGPRGGPSAAPAPAPTPAPTTGIEGTTDGALSEWASQQFGAVGLASRLWTRPEPATGEGDVRWLDWNDKVMGGSAFVPFHPFDHPTLGKVEVGGWKPGVRLNPPIEQVGPIVDGHLAFLKDLAGRLPVLAIREAKAEAKGGGLYEIKATVENSGIFPTALAQGIATRKAPPVLVKLGLGDAKLLAGRARDRVESLAGSGGSREFRWLVLAPPGTRTVTLEASCPRAGSARREIPLP